MGNIKLNNNKQSSQTVLVATVGTGGPNNPVWEALIYSVKYHKAKVVYWLCSEVTAKDTLPKIKPNINIPESSQFRKIAKDENNIETLYTEYIDIFDEIKDKFPQATVVADFTSGTKAMSAALSLAAISRANQNDSLAYMVGERDISGRAIRTDKAISFQPFLIYAERQLSQAIEYFNEYDYCTAHKLASQSDIQLKKQKDNPLHIKAQAIIELANAYHLWDLFQYKLAVRRLKKAATERYFNKETCQILKPQIDFLSECAKKDNQWSYFRIVDLFANAKRCFHRGRYDDAVARCYRLLEYLAQRELKLKYEIDTGNIDIDKIPQQLRDNFKTKKTCGLVEDYRLLLELGHPLGKAFEEAHKGHGTWDAPKGKLSVAINKRNKSLLAHGFDPIKEKDASKILNIIENWLTQHVENFDTLVENTNFITVNHSSFAV